jgi:hypothetical protein
MSKSICKVLFILCVVLHSHKSYGQDSAQSGFLNPNAPVDSLSMPDSLANDSARNILYSFNAKRTLLDTLRNDTILLAIFKPYIEIQYTYFQNRKTRKNLPTVKEIELRVIHDNQWKFWVIVIILLYIAFVRISNANNFRVFILSVFNLGLSRKIWEDQRSFFGFIILQLFAIYLFIASLIITNYMEFKHLLFFNHYVWQYLMVLVALIIIYGVKFIIHALLGVLLKMPNLAVGFISNTISVNNFIALVLFPFVVFSTYANSSVLAQVLAQTVVAIFILSVLYRVIRSILLSNSFFSFPTFYLFLYLCALEIAPWFIIGKFLNNYIA